MSRILSRQNLNWLQMVNIDFKPNKNKESKIWRTTKKMWNNRKTKEEMISYQISNANNNIKLLIFTNMMNARYNKVSTVQMSPKASSSYIILRLIRVDKYQWINNHNTQHLCLFDLQQTQFSKMTHSHFSLHYMFGYKLLIYFHTMRTYPRNVTWIVTR